MTPTQDAFLSILADCHIDEADTVTGITADHLNDLAKACGWAGLTDAYRAYEAEIKDAEAQPADTDDETTQDDLETTRGIHVHKEQE